MSLSSGASSCSGGTDYGVVEDEAAAAAAAVASKSSESARLSVCPFGRRPGWVLAVRCDGGGGTAADVEVGARHPLVYYVK